LQAELTRDGSLDRIIGLLSAQVEAAVVLLARLLQLPSDSASIPGTAKGRAAASASQAPLQISTSATAAATSSSSTGGGLDGIKLKLHHHLRVLDALLGPTGVLRIVLSDDGESSACELNSTQLSALMAAACPTLGAAPHPAGSSLIGALRLLFVHLKGLRLDVSAFQLKSTFDRLHDLGIASLTCQTVQLLCQLLPNYGAHDGSDIKDAKDRADICERLLQVVHLLRDIATASDDSRRSSEWHAQFQKLLPSPAEHVDLLVHIASCFNAMMRVRRLPGGLHRHLVGSGRTQSSSSASSSGSQQPSQRIQHDHQGADSQSSNNNTASQLRTDDEPSDQAARDAASDRMQQQLLRLQAAMCRACAYVQGMAGVAERAKQELLLHALEFAHHLLKRIKPANLMALMQQQETFLQPLLSALLFNDDMDAPPHPQLLLKTIEIISRTLSMASDPAAHGCAASLKSISTIPTLMAHCQRLSSGQPADAGAADGVAPPSVIAAALQLLTDIVTLCAHEPWEQWSQLHRKLLSGLTKCR
jgi:hypothetical protein